MAKELFSDEIKSGRIIMESSSKAPRDINGFPYFLNIKNGLSHTGYPKDKKTLYDKLKVTLKENFTYNNNNNIWIGIV
jgi:hypothetical protein